MRKLPLFTDDHDREHFLALLDLTATRYRIQIHAYCLMTNHFHLLVTTEEANISQAMQYLNGRYAQWFNARHGFERHVLERRFYSALIETDDHLLNLARYIVLNPVRAGICATAAEWRWSSYRATLTPLATAIPRITRWLLAFFGRELEEARARFAAFVRSGEPSAVP